MGKQYTQQFKEYAIYEFAFRNGFKNHTECVLHFGLNEYKRKRDQFFDEFWNECQKNNNQTLIIPKKRTPRPTKEQFIQNLNQSIPLILDEIRKNPSVKFDYLHQEYKVNKTYIHALVLIGVLKNIGNKVTSYHKIVREVETEALVIELRDFVNNNYSLRKKRLKHAVN